MTLGHSKPRAIKWFEVAKGLTNIITASKVSFCCTRSDPLPNIHLWTMPIGPVATWVATLFTRWGSRILINSTVPMRKPGNEVSFP